jgi:hypothetical protein
MDTLPKGKIKKFSFMPGLLDLPVLLCFDSNENIALSQLGLGFSNSGKYEIYYSADLDERLISGLNSYIRSENSALKLLENIAMPFPHEIDGFQVDDASWPVEERPSYRGRSFNALKQYNQTTFSYEFKFIKNEKTIDSFRFFVTSEPSSTEQINSALHYKEGFFSFSINHNYYTIKNGNRKLIKSQKFSFDEDGNFIEHQKQINNQNSVIKRSDLLNLNEENVGFKEKMKKIGKATNEDLLDIGHWKQKIYALEELKILGMDCYDLNSIRLNYNDIMKNMVKGKLF